MQLSRSTRASRTKLALKLGVSAIVVIVSSAPALAQETAAAAPGDDAQIIVTGIRASITTAREIKRNAEVVVDSISAEDIGALPDRSVSEALQRIPGVTLQRTNENRDPARMAAEGGGIFVRGLSWVRSETNGRDIFSANNGRGLSFEDISADLVAGVDVYKNPSADLIEGGVGGLVNLRTRKPFDAPGQIIALSGDYNYADLRKKGYWSGNALYSNRWNLGGGEVGLLLSGSIGNIGNRTDSIQTGNYAANVLGAPSGGLATGTTVYIPQSLGWRRIDWQQRRTAFDAVLQLSPSNDMTFTFEALYAKASPRDIEHAEGLYYGGCDAGSCKYDSRNVLVGGKLSNANIDLDTRYGSSDKVTQDYSINWKYKPGDHWTFSADVQRVFSKADVLSMTAFTEFGVAPGSNARPTLTFDLSGNSPSISTAANGASLATQSNYWWAAAMDHIEKNDAGSWAERADVEYTFDQDSFFKSFRMGVRATDKEAITRQTGYNWSLLSQQFWGSGGGAPVYLNGTGTPPNSGLPSQSELFDYGNFFRGKVGVPGVGWFPSAALVGNGTANAYSYLKSTETSGWGWSPLTSASYASSAPQADNPSGGITGQYENTKSAYGLLRFGSDGSGFLGHFDGNIGVRVVETDTHSNFKVLVTGPNSSYSACLTSNPGNPAACTSLLDAITFAGGPGASATVASGVASNRYTNVLPTLNLRFYLKDNLLLRLAAGRAMVRPNFVQMMPYTTLGFGFLSDGFTSSSNPLTGTAGNPYLKPTKATQFDASLEYYWGRSNSLTFAAFYKDVNDFIYSGSVPVTYTNNGITKTFVLSQYVNGSHGTIRGFEAGYQQFFDFLPGPLSGFGFQGNVTFVDSTGGKNLAVNVFDNNQTSNSADTTLPLEGMSKWSFNAALLYEKHGVSARLAYNWRSEYLLTTSAANINKPVWFEAYGQLDGSLLYAVTSNVKVGVQATNLLNTRTYLDVGGAALHPRYSWTDTDRRIAFLVRSRF